MKIYGIFTGLTWRLNLGVLVGLQAFLRNIHIWVERVPSEDNISDLLSRGEHGAMHSIGAQWRVPVMGDIRILQQ